MVFGEDGVMMGEGEKNSKGRIKAQPFGSDVRARMKDNAVQC